MQCFVQFPSSEPSSIERTRNSIVYSISIGARLLVMSSLSVCTRVLVTAATVSKGECTCSANNLAREILFASISATFLALGIVHRAKRNVRTGTDYA